MSGEPTRIKLCGLAREEDVRAVARIRPDFCGFVVNVPASRRSVSPERLVRLCGLLDRLEAERAPGTPRILRVGVLANQPLGTVADMASAAHLDFVQLHGNENRPYIDALRAKLPRGCGIIKAFRMRSASDAAAADESHADLVLLDSGAGSGETFDWGLASRVGRPFLLAGGLGPGNLDEAIRAVHPWGVDMSSGVETDGRKDPKKMRAAVEAARKERA